MKLRRRKGAGSGAAELPAAARRGARAAVDVVRRGPGEGGWDARELLRGRSGRWLATLAIALACFGVGWLVASWWLFPGGEDTGVGRLIRVPDLVGLPVEEARDRARGAALQPEIRASIHHPEAEAGVVLAQSPLPEQLALTDAAVHLTLSLGPETRTVPDLRGLSAPDAMLVLRRLGLSVQVRVVASSAGQSGVQGTRPEPGREVAVPGEVELLVGEGPQVVVVPNLEGRHVDDVEAVLNDVGLQLGTVRFEPESGAAPGRVVGQSPPAGYSLRGGGFVSVEVAGRPGETAPRGRETEGRPSAPDGGPDADGTAAATGRGHGMDRTSV